MIRFSRTLAALLASGACTVVLAPAASAVTTEVTCVPPSGNTATFSPPLTLAPQTTTTSNTYRYAPCTSPTQPGLNSGTRSSVNVQTRSCLDLLTTGTITSGLFAGGSVLQVNTGPSVDVLLCTAGLGIVQGINSLVTLQITS